MSLLAFSVVGFFLLYALQRLQASLPFNPTGVGNVSPALSLNTAVSFLTNTNWQAYAGESDHEPSHPDGRADRPAVRVGRDRDGGHGRRCCEG